MMRLVAGGAVAVGLAPLLATRLAAAEATSVLGWELPPLPYAPNALEPHIDALTMEIHYGKHHAAYLNNAKKLLEAHPEWRSKSPEAVLKSLGDAPDAIRGGLRNNVGGHVNHAFFWNLLTPGGAPLGPKLSAALEAQFKSIDSFKTQFASAAMGRFGSGWAWLSRKADGSLLIHSTANQDSPLLEGLHPVIGLDVWEHAYYLKHQNVRANYVSAFWNVLNGEQAEANFLS